MKLNSNFVSGKATGSLYILNGSSLNTNNIIAKTKDFFTLAGLKIKVKTLVKGSKLGTTDGFAVIGKSKQKAIDLLFGNQVLKFDISMNDDPQFVPPYKKCPPSWVECKQTVDLQGWPLQYLEKLNPERSTTRAIVVNEGDMNDINKSYTNNEDDNQLNKPGGTYRSVAFLILHGTAHQAGFSHDYEPKGQAYCMDGQQLPNFLGLSLPVGTYNTYEKLIALAKKDYNYMIIQTNARYGY